MESVETELWKPTPEPLALMTEKTYRNKFAAPLVKKLKALVKTVLARCFEAWDSYHRLNRANGKLYRENESLTLSNDRLYNENQALKAQNREYAFLRKVFGEKQIDDLVARAREQEQQRKQKQRSRNRGYEAR